MDIVDCRDPHERPSFLSSERHRIGEWRRVDR
jgi:hypothetical protein